MWSRDRAIPIVAKRASVRAWVSRQMRSRGAPALEAWSSTNAGRGNAQNRKRAYAKPVGDDGAMVAPIGVSGSTNARHLTNGVAHGGTSPCSDSVLGGH